MYILAESSERNNRRCSQKLTQTVTPIILRTATKTVKYLGINLTHKKIQDTYMENYEILRREIKEDLNKWRNLLC